MEQIEVPNVPFAAVVFFLFLVWLLGVSLALWIQGLVRWMAGNPVLPKAEPRVVPPWGLIDLLVAFFSVVGFQWLAFSIGFKLGLAERANSEGDYGIGMVFLVSSVQSLAIVLTTAFIAQRCRTGVSAVGWSIERLGDDIVLGIRTFIVLAPLVYALMFLATWLSGHAYDHPIQKLASENPWFLIPTSILAVFFAPLGEEFAFRVLLQGFLESMALGRISAEKLLFGRKGMGGSAGIVEREFVEVGEGGEDDIPSERIATSGEEGRRFDDAGCPAVLEDNVPWWPTIVSGSVFGLFHIPYGMSWIPLIVFGIALGWLYRVTNRIWPSLVVHMCLNTMSMIGFAISLLSRPA